MTQLAQFINIIVSIFEWCYFCCGFAFILVTIDWAKIERERSEWQS